MVCKNCGSQLEEGAKFCGICGTPVVANEQPVVSDVVTNNVGNASNIVDSMNSVGGASNIADGMNNVGNASNIVDSMNNAGIDKSADVVESIPVIEPIAAPVGNENPINNNVESNNKKSNSNLKNALIILLVCALICGAAFFAVTKLFKKNSKSAEKIDYAINNMQDMKSFNMNVGLNLLAESSGETVDVNVDLKSSINIDKKLASFNISAVVPGMTMEIPAYLDLGDNAALMFKVPTDNTWYKISLAGMIDESIFDSADSSSNKKYRIEDYLRNDEFIEKVSSDMDGTEKYVLHFTKDVLKKLSEDNNNDFDYSMVEQYGLEDGFDVSLYINTKENYLTKMTFDFSGKTFDGIKFDKFVFSLEVTDLNKVNNIIIPSEALNGQEFNNEALNSLVPSTDSSLNF